MGHGNWINGGLDAAWHSGIELSNDSFLQEYIHEYLLLMVMHLEEMSYS